MILVVPGIKYDKDNVISRNGYARYLDTIISAITVRILRDDGIAHIDVGLLWS